MDVEITGKFVDKFGTPDHLAFVMMDKSHKLITNDVGRGWMSRSIHDQQVAKQVAIPNGCAVTLLGPVLTSNTPERSSEMHVLVRASEALVWRFDTGEWSCEHNVETVIRLCNFDGSIS